jgi:aspartate beta-hydroxylase
VAEILVRTGRAEEARQCAELAVAMGLWRHPLQRPVDYLPALPPRPVYDPANFWFVELLEASYPVIRREVDALTGSAGHGFVPVDEPLLDSGRWDQVVLYEGGRRFDRACSLLPVTSSVVAQIPEATSLGPGVVTLSWLHPGAHIVPHCGHSNSALRVHLGIRVPPGPRIRIGDEVLAWQDGRCIVFDDSFEHEVWHDGEQSRIVLLLDVPHPDLDAAERSRRLANRSSISDKIGAYLAEHRIRRIDTREDQLVLQPDAGVEALIRRYMAETSVSAVELRDGVLHFD